MGRARLTLALAAFGLAIAGCGGEDDSSGGSETPTDSATSDRSLPETISADDAPVIELKDRELTRVELPTGDWMTYAFDSLWVKRDDGDVARVDPADGRVTDTVPGGPFKHPLCQGIGSSEDAIWSCPTGAESITRIDPQTNSVSATVDMAKVPDQGRLVSAADHQWVLTGSGEVLTGIDHSTDKPSNEIELGATCTDLAGDGTTLWAVCPLDDLLLRIDPEAGEVAGELELPDARTAAVGEDVWVGFEGGVAQVDPDALEVEAVYGLYPRYGGSIFAGADAVWVREEDQDRFLTQIDPEAHEIVETIVAPDLPSGGDVVVIDDSVWATAYNDQTLVELSSAP